MTDARAGLWVCPECGERTRVSEPTEPWECANDGTEVVYITPKEEALIKAQSETVPKSELRALVEEWRDSPEWLYNDEDAAMAARMCADELEELIEE